MAGRFMVIRKVVLPIMSVIILCSQLAGCASLNSQEFLETVNNVDEVVIEYNELDPSSSSASSSDSVKVGDKAYAYDFNNEDEEDPEIGVINAEEAEPEELSGDALIDFFKLAYKTSDGISYLKTLEEKVDFEIDVLGLRAENENKGLPADYADQYRAWRPVDEAPESTAQQVSEAPKNQDQGSNQQQQQNQSQSQQNQSTTQQTKPSTQTQPTTPQPSGGKNIYGGFNTYDEYIEYLHSLSPEYSIEQIKEAFPDPATGEVGEAAEWDAQAGLLNGG